MDRADARAGQHCLDRLWDHGHVDDDAVAFFHAFGTQGAGKAGDAGLKLGIGDAVFRASDGAIMNDGDLRAAPGFDVAVNGVVAGVHLCIGEPFVHVVPAIKKCLGRGLVPVDGLGLL